MGYWYTDPMTGEKFYDSMRPKQEIAHLQGMDPTSAGMAGAIKRRLAELQGRPPSHSRLANPFGGPGPAPGPAPLSALPLTAREPTRQPLLPWPEPVAPTAPAAPVAPVAPAPLPTSPLGSSEGLLRLIQQMGLG